MPKKRLKSRKLSGILILSFVALHRKDIAQSQTRLKLQGILETLVGTNFSQVTLFHGLVQSLVAAGYRYVNTGHPIRHPRSFSNHSSSLNFLEIPEPERISGDYALHHFCLGSLRGMLLQGLEMASETLLENAAFKNRVLPPKLRRLLIAVLKSAIFRPFSLYSHHVTDHCLGGGTASGLRTIVTSFWAYMKKIIPVSILLEIIMRVVFNIPEQKYCEVVLTSVLAFYRPLYPQRERRQHVGRTGGSFDNGKSVCAPVTTIYQDGVGNGAFIAQRRRSSGALRPVPAGNPGDQKGTIERSASKEKHQDPQKPVVESETSRSCTSTSQSPKCTCVVVYNTQCRRLMDRTEKLKRRSRERRRSLPTPKLPYEHPVVRRNSISLPDFLKGIPDVNFVPVRARILVVAKKTTTDGVAVLMVHTRKRSPVFLGLKPIKKAQLKHSKRRDMARRELASWKSICKHCSVCDRCLMVEQPDDEFSTSHPASRSSKDPPPPAPICRACEASMEAMNPKKNESTDAIEIEAEASYEEEWFPCDNDEMELAEVEDNSKTNL